VARVVKKAMLEFEEALACASKSDPKRLHAHVRSKQRVHDLIRSIETADGETTVEHDVICMTLNDYFNSVFVQETDAELPVFENRTDLECKLDETIFATILEKRRERGDLIEQYKITFRIDEVNFHVPQIPPN
jgi:hypothetical protein